MMESPAESNDKPQFTCGECDQSFPTAGQLNNHHSTHTWKQCFQCNFCSYTTTSIGQMKKHAETHSNRKKFANTSSTLDPRGEKSDQKHDNQEETIEISDGECADSGGENEAVILIESDNEQEDGRAHTHREEIFAQLEDQRSDIESATGKVPQSEPRIDNSQSSISNASLENKPLSSDGKPEQNLFQETVARNNVPPGNRDSSHQSRNIFAQLMGDFSVATLQPSSAMADCITSTGNERQQSQTSASPDNTNSAAPGSTAETTAETTADPGADIQCEVVSSSNSTRKKKKREKKLWTCECGFTSYYLDNLRRHLRKGSCAQQKHNVFREKIGPRRHECSRCPFWAPTRLGLVKHQKAHLKTYFCSECPFQTKHTAKLKRHAEMHKDNHIYSCSKCSFSSDHRNILTRHKKLHEVDSSNPTVCQKTSKSRATEPELFCSMCSFTTREGKYYLLEHQAEHYEDNRMRCDQCDLVTMDKRNFQSHLWTHDGQKPFKCTHCPYRTAHAKSLDRHKKNHNANLPFQCHLCSFSTKGQSPLSAHMNVHGIHNRFDQKTSATSKSSRRKLDDLEEDHCSASETNDSLEATKMETPTQQLDSREAEDKDSNDDGENFNCKHCSFYAKDRYMLLLHAAKHYRDMIYRCDQCDFKSRHSVSLKEHLFVHLGQKPYVCTKDPKCPFVSAHQGNVRSHMKAHSANFPLKYKKYLLLVHEAKHSGEKAFHCDECEFSTLNVHNLSLHLRAHEQRKFKRYKCDECPYVAERQRALVNHTNNHKADLPFKCKYCSYTATRGYYIRVHTLLHIHSKKNRVETEKSRGDSEGVVNTVTEGDDPETSHGDDLDIDGKVDSEKTSKPVPGIRLVMTGSGQYKTTEPSKPAGKRIYCDYCDHSTTRPRDMKVHVRLHTGERPYACPDCPFRAIQSHHLQKHRRYHQANLAEKCKLCTFSCRSASLLRSHVQLHNDKKNWHRCPHCSFTTSSYRVANTHIRKQHVLSGFTVATSTLPVKKKSPPQQDEDVVSVNSSKNEEAGQSPSLKQSSDMVGERLDPAMDKHEADSDSADDYEEQADILSVTHEEESTDQSNTDGVEECQVKCDQCEHSSATYVDHLIHLSVHTNDKTILCDQCDYTTSNESLFKEHWQTHTSENQFKCDLCSFIGTGRANLLQHQSFHSAKQALKCRWCSFSCSERQHLENHRRLHGHGRFKYKCQYCHFNTDNLFLHLVHKAKHSKDHKKLHGYAGSFKCNQCSFATDEKYRLLKHKAMHFAQDLHRLQDHVQKHGAGLPFKCTQCSYTCERETDLTQHSRYHGVKGAFVCQECSYSTEKKVCLLLHQASHAADGMYSCDRCDLKTSDKELLVSHLKEHDGTQVFRCSLCPYSTVIESNYTVHQRRHRARLLHCCKHCSYSTGKKKDMEAHNKMHERKFRCNECTYTTDIRYQFLIHRGLHTEKRIFSCDKCPFRTKAMVALRNHIVNQCNNNKLRCSECPFVTNRGAILKTHMKYHNTNFKYKCDHCSFSTALGWHFYRHAKVHKRGTRQRQKPSTSSTEWHDSRSDKEEEKTEFEPSWTEGDHESDVDVENISEDYNADQSSHGRENRKTDETRNVTGESESTEAKVKDVSGPSPATTSTNQETEKQQTVFNLVKSYASYHLSCRFCPYKTSKRLHHMSHEAKHGADLPFKCSKCSYSDRFEGKIAIHMRVHGCPGRYQCQHCYYSTNNEGFLQVHMNSRHRTSKVFHCSKCEFSTERPKYLKEHIQKQHLCKPLPTKVKVLEYKCIRCSFQAATLAELWEHHKLQHQEEEKHFYKDGDYRCRHCSFVATKQNRMARHIRIHLRDLAYTPQPTEGATSGLENYAATQADGNTLGSDENNQDVGDESSAKNCNVISVEKSVVKSKNTARKSVPLGNKEKTTYQCPDCKFTATREHLVLAHARNTHRKEPDVEKQKVARYPRRFKLYKCQSCPYSSYRRIHVNIHEKYHSANYPFKCDQCTYSCQFLYKLLQHKALHDRGDNVYQAAVPKNITVYKCPLCPYTSYKKSVVQEHKTYHKAGYPHKCSKCSYSCKTDAKLQDHIKLHTQDDIVDQEGITMYQPPQREQVSLFKCSMCPYRSYKCQHVLCHERLHNANLPNKCRFCSYSSLFQYKVKQHQKLHEEEDGEDGLSDTSKDASQNAVCSTMEDGEDVTTDEELQSEGIVSKKRGLNAVFDNSDRYPLRAEGRLSIRLFRCAKCHFYSKSWRLLQLHKAQHELKMIRSDSMKRSLPAAQPDREAEGGRYFCRYCPYGSTHISHVWRHEERHNAGLPFKCRYCSYSSLLEFWTDRHEAVHREERQVEAMQDIRNLQIQPEERSPVFAYGDDTLFAGIDTEEELATNSDGSDDTYSCKLCGRTFEEWRTYQHHARQHRQAGEEHVSHAVALGDPFTGRVFYVFTCKLCGRRFTGQVDWIQHMQHHRRNNRVPDRR
ncbi:hypothetical protein Bbelb_407500 [Branchiostoma belcheri]|nr:hypothetical protein Bbelb_407500 [Branchiostoma belcheri]